MLLIYLIKIGLVQTASCEELLRTETADAKGKGDNFPGAHEEKDRQQMEIIHRKLCQEKSVSL